MNQWKCQSCPNTVDRPESSFIRATKELEGRDGVGLEEVMELALQYDTDDRGAFDVPTGWMKLVRANTFNVFCSWSCLRGFADIWGAIEQFPEVQGGEGKA